MEGGMEGGTGVKCELRGRVMSDSRNQDEDSNSLQGTVGSVLLVQREQKNSTHTHTYIKTDLCTFSTAKG